MTILNLNRKNILNILSKKDFYDECEAFEFLKEHVIYLIQYMKELNLNDPKGKPKKGCSKCTLARIYRFQTMLVNMFSARLVNLFSENNKEELEKFKNYLSKYFKFDKIQLNYKSGKEEQQIILD